MLDGDKGARWKIILGDQKLRHVPPSSTKQTSALAAHPDTSTFTTAFCSKPPLTTRSYDGGRQRRQLWVLTFNAAASHAQAAGVRLQRGLARELIPCQVPSRGEEISAKQCVHHRHRCLLGHHGPGLYDVRGSERDFPPRSAICLR